MKERPIHLAGHISRQFTTPMITSPCHFSAVLTALSYKDLINRTRFTLNPEKVTCKKCLHVIKTGKDRDPIHKLDPNHNCW